MEKGKYHGVYRFDDEKYGRLMGFDKTYFTIDITDFDGKHFKGSVEDDLLTGGMEGKGTVSGEVIESRIYFIKRMPYEVLLIEDNVTKEYQHKINKTRKHPPVYYEGDLAETNNYRGKWNFRYYNVLISLVIWFKKIKTGGTWEMTKVTE